jgi:hypothetical protein
MLPQGHFSIGTLRWCRLLVAIALCLLWACETPQQTETAMFERAEQHYRLGNYDDAIKGYQAFLQQYPTSPLARTAQMRVRSIHREVASVLDRQGMPRPIYHGSTFKESTADVEAEPDL